LILPTSVQRPKFKNLIPILKKAADTIFSVFHIRGASGDSCEMGNPKDPNTNPLREYPLRGAFLVSRSVGEIE
jgi:hypothetical protein